MASILPFDELNRFTESLRERFYGVANISERKEEEEDIIDEMLDLFLLAYAMGNEVTNDNLDFGWKPTADDVIDTVNAEVANRTWRERVEDYFSNGGSVDDLVRIAETETHRIANTAALATAKEAGAKFKTWVTMMDDRVRDAHQPLEGATVPIDGTFVTWDGFETQAPGLFGIPELDINCRCELIFS